MNISKSLCVGDLSFRYAYASQPALGLIVSKHYGNSVARNLFKRRCRAIFRNKFITRGVLIALIVRPVKQNISFQNMDDALGELYEKHFV